MIRCLDYEMDVSVRWPVWDREGLGRRYVWELLRAVTLLVLHHV